jgi:hypothetical protein
MSTNQKNAAGSESSVALVHSGDFCRSRLRGRSLCRSSRLAASKLVRGNTGWMLKGTGSNKSASWLMLYFLATSNSRLKCWSGLNFVQDFHSPENLQNSALSLY